MNEKLPYEQIIADKLQDLPVPDRENSWMQMRSLLDEKMPKTGGGGGSGSAEFKPFGRLWWAGAVAVMITTVVWFMAENRKLMPASLSQINNRYTEQKSTLQQQQLNRRPDANASGGLQGAKTSPSTPAIGDENNNAANNQPGSAASNNNGAVGASAGTSTNPPETGASAASGNDIAITNTRSAPGSARPNSGTPGVAQQSDNLALKPCNSLAEKPGNNDAAKNYPVAGKTTRNKSTINSNLVAGAQESATKPGRINQSKGSRTGAENGDNSILTGKPGLGANGNDQTTGNEADLAAPDRFTNGNRSTPKGRSANKSSRTLTHDQATSAWRQPAAFEIPSYTAGLSSGFDTASHIKSRLINTRPLPPDVAELAASKAAKAATKKQRGLGLGKFFESIHLPYQGENWWAAGISLNSSLVTGSQEACNYNVNGTRSVFSDYLPSPYLQYHVNSNFYLQTEFNFSSPQHTSDLLISSAEKAGAGTAQTRYMENKYVQKLYYFNLPLSMHYSPVRNLFLAAGLQFSSLQSGILRVDQRRIGPGPDDEHSEVLKFRDDSVAAKLSPSEWRWETGANYYFSRFTLGARYNKSLSDLVNIRPAYNLPVTNSRNAAFVLFMRYNIFESRKKPSSNGAVSSLIK